MHTYFGQAAMAKTKSGLSQNGYGFGDDDDDDDDDDNDDDDQVQVQDETGPRKRGTATQRIVRGGARAYGN